MTTHVRGLKLRQDVPTHEAHAATAIGRDSWEPNAFHTAEADAWLENIKL